MLQRVGRCLVATPEMLGRLQRRNQAGRGERTHCLRTPARAGHRAPSWRIRRRGAPRGHVATRCADPTTEEVLDAMRPVLAHPGVREVTYMPQLGSRSPSGGPADQRWYFVLRYVAADGEPWKVDVSLWRLGDAPRELYFDPDALCRRLTAETRGAILWIKDIWHRRPCYPDVVGGVDIYDAVLNHGVRAPAEFAAYLRARGMSAD
jgi:hypothetical protein